MNTPIYDFLKNYSCSDISRFHMPGHKGKGFLGCEMLDITEIKGADSLYEADGIIGLSEKNASEIFETGATYYSTEGSSLAVKAMLYAAFTACGNAKKKIAAVRNVHKSFINACAMLGIDIVWIYPKNSASLCSGTVTASEIEDTISKNNELFGLYLTSPNYLGEITDIQSISKICKKYNIPLLVDNAHGAYLKHCGMHPIDLGADICCDSAHKTLPVLTGGAYLHISKSKAELFCPYIKNAMSAFGSTSPSYLILASLDLCNKYMCNNYPAKLQACINKVSELKEFIKTRGFEIGDTEPLKITVLANGEVLGEKLRKLGIEYEYADKTALVLMLTPENSEADYLKVKKAFNSVNPVPPLPSPEILPGKKMMTVREAFLSPYTTVNVANCVEHICASACVSCPPAVPIAVSGEIITKQTAAAFKFYGIETINII